MPTESDKIIKINLDLKETNIYRNAPFETKEMFWSTDINSSYLEFTTASDVTAGQASLVLRNEDDGSITQRNMEVNGSPFFYQLKEAEVSRAGRWYGQIVIEVSGKKLTSNEFRFLVKGSLLDSSKPALFDIENYTKLSSQLGDLYDQFNSYLADVSLTESEREAAELSRKVVFEDSQKARELAFLASQLDRQEEYNQLIMDTEADVTVIKNESKNTIDSMITAGSSEINQSKNEASISAQTAQQAMIDFLAIVGVDIATLGADGKLSASQIPALAINDTFVVHSQAEITALKAQRGDVAIHVLNENVSDAFILTTDNPTVLSNWIKLGVSYVAKAGHAETATQSVNSEKVNGHRLVTMTQAEYDLGAKDPNTVYLVEG